MADPATIIGISTLAVAVVAIGGLALSTRKNKSTPVIAIEITGSDEKIRPQHEIEYGRLFTGMGKRKSKKSRKSKKLRKSRKK